MDFKDRLKMLRQSKHMTQAELASQLKASKALIGFSENGKRLPSFEKQEDIADFFNVTLDYLLGRDDRSVYYLDPEVAEMAQKLYDDPDKRALFDASNKLSKEDMQYVVNLMNRLEKKDD